MKKRIAGMILFLFGIGCGFGAFFMLNKGVEVKKTEMIKAETLAVQELIEEPVQSDEVIVAEEQEEPKEDVPNFGTQEIIQQEERIIPKTEDGNRIWFSSILMGISLAVICIESLKKGVRLI